VETEGSGRITRVRTTVRRADGTVTRIALFEGGAMAKVVDVHRTDRHGTKLIPMDLEVGDVLDGTSTRLELSSVRVDLAPGELAYELPGALFTEAHLDRRARRER
jgi:hypothetical protein